MNALLDYIKTVLTQTDSLESALRFLPIFFKKDFLVAYIHSKTRMPDDETIKALKSLLDEDGYTPDHLTPKELSFLKKDYPNLLQSVSYMCLKKESKKKINYATKHKNDYWKKIQDIEDFNAVFDICNITDQEICEAEFSLREIIRKRKEVHALKDLGYIFLAESTKDISKVFEHYFNTKYILINDKYYIGWTKTLREINMRYFVCQPD